jgi:hypothetical protein
MPKCQFLFSAVFGFRNSTQKIFSELDQKVRKSISQRNTLEGTRDGRVWARGAPHPRATRPGPGPRRPRVWPPWLHPGAAPSPIYTPREVILRAILRNPRKVLPRPPSSTLDREGSGVPPGTLLERRITTGGLYITMPAPGVMCE